MTIDNLWDKLVPIEASKATLIRDLKEGTVPELPYFVVNQDEVKAAIGKKLSELDLPKMQTNLIIGHYGNGKTNLLKYLKLFFQTNEMSVEVLFSRIDIEQPDVVLYMLKLLQDNHTGTLVDQIIALRNEGINWKEKLISNGADTFAAIVEYTEKIFSTEMSEDQLKKLIYLGTGRLYTIGHFNEFSLPKLQNFNRREILVLFLNILSAGGKSIVFALDEAERILEKSPLRFNQFLTSYRELIDLFNRVNGHYLLTCFTHANGIQVIEKANPAFFTRISASILEVKAITKAADIKTLVEYLNELFETGKQDDVDQIVIQASKKNKSGNRDLIRHIAQLLMEDQENLTLAESLKKYSLIRLFNTTKTDLERDGILKSIHQKFFDPLEYFLEASFRMLDGNILDRRRNQAFIDFNNRTIQHFIFNDSLDLENLNKKLNELCDVYEMKLVIYSPVRLELSSSSITLNNANLTFSIVNYEPEELFVLLNMFRENYELQETIAAVISNYTDNNL